MWETTKAAADDDDDGFPEFRQFAGGGSA